MTVRDIFSSFTDLPNSATAFSIIGNAGTYLAPNSIDTGPFGSYLSELTSGDTSLSPGNAFRDPAGGDPMCLIVDWIVPPQGGASVDVQLITSASPALTSPIVMFDFEPQPIANLSGPYQYGRYARQIQALPRSANWLEWIGLQIITVGTMSAGSCIAWLGLDVDSVVLGAASGYTLK